MPISDQDNTYVNILSTQPEKPVSTYDLISNALLPNYANAEPGPEAVEGLVRDLFPIYDILKRDYKGEPVGGTDIVLSAPGLGNAVKPVAALLPLAMRKQLQRVKGMQGKERELPDLSPLDAREMRVLRMYNKNVADPADALRIERAKMRRLDDVLMRKGVDLDPPSTVQMYRQGIKPVDLEVDKMMREKYGISPNDKVFGRDDATAYAKYIEEASDEDGLSPYIPHPGQEYARQMQDDINNTVYGHHLDLDFAAAEEAWRNRRAYREAVADQLRQGYDMLGRREIGQLSPDEYARLQSLAANVQKSGNQQQRKAFDDTWGVFLKQDRPHVDVDNMPTGEDIAKGYRKKYRDSDRAEDIKMIQRGREAMGRLYDPSTRKVTDGQAYVNMYKLYDDIMRNGTDAEKAAWMRTWGKARKEGYLDK